MFFIPFPSLGPNQVRELKLSNFDILLIENRKFANVSNTNGKWLLFILDLIWPRLFIFEMLTPWSSSARLPLILIDIKTRCCEDLIPWWGLSFSRPLLNTQISPHTFSSKIRKCSSCILYLKILSMAQRTRRLRSSHPRISYIFWSMFPNWPPCPSPV